MSIKSMNHKAITPFNISFRGVKGNVSTDITRFLIEPDENVPGNDINIILKKRQFNDFDSLFLKVSCKQ